MSSSPNQRKELFAVCSNHQEAVATFMRTGHIEQARDSFTSSFASVNRMLRQHASLPNEAAQLRAFYFPGSPLVRTTKESPIFSEPPCATTATEHEEQEQPLLETEAQHTLFRTEKPLLFPTTPGSSVSNADDDEDDDVPIQVRVLNLPYRCTVNQLAFVALYYNMALLTHLSALEDLKSSNESSNSSPSEDVNSSSSKRQNMVGMLTSMKLWKLVYEFQWRSQLNLKPFHALSIMHNLGHAQFVSGNVTGSQSCCENILSAIQLLEGRNQRQHVPCSSFFQHRAVCMLLACAEQRTTTTTTPAVRVASAA